MNDTIDKKVKHETEIQMATKKKIINTILSRIIIAVRNMNNRNSLMSQYNQMNSLIMEITM